MDDDERLDLLEELLDDYGHDQSKLAVERLRQMKGEDLGLILHLCRATADAWFARGVTWTQQRSPGEVAAWLEARSRRGRQ